MREVWTCTKKNYRTGNSCTMFFSSAAEANTFCASQADAKLWKIEQAF